MDEELSNGSMDDQSDGSMEELSETSSLLSLSCSFSSFEHEEPDSDTSSEDELGTVEPYMYEPEESDHEGLTSNSGNEGEVEDSDDEARIGCGTPLLWPPLGIKFCPL